MGRPIKNKNAIIQSILNGICSGDSSQMDVILSTSPRIFVTAPAGYGKTATMTGKIVYELASETVPCPKQILALTFSVSAARKMRSEVDYALREAQSQLKNDCRYRVFVSNYHGFARRLLSLYGDLVGLDRRKIKEMRICDEAGLLSSLRVMDVDVPDWTAVAITAFPKAVKDGDCSKMNKCLPVYNDAISKLGIVHDCLTYNSLITFAIKLMTENPGLSNFLRKMYVSIMIDEAQDTNVLHYRFLSCLIDNRTRCSFFGDPLQRVYGFLGALSDFKTTATNDYGLREYALLTNHRFEPNSELLLLDKSLRILIEEGDLQEIGQGGSLRVAISRTFNGQTDIVYSSATHILQEHTGSTLAVLINRRGELSARIRNKLESCGISYFDALFDDNSLDYTSMCDTCLSKLNEQLDIESSISTNEAFSLINQLAKQVLADNYEYAKSYHMLLNAFAERIVVECAEMDGNDRYDYLASTLANHSLRRYSEFIKARITISTIHAAKGLEWDYVIVPGVTKWDFTISSCGSCRQKNSEGVLLPGAKVCQIADWHFSPRMLDQLNIWYVALTRARKSVIAISSYERMTKNGNLQTLPVSCLLGLPGITLKIVNDIDE